jgi:Family of unknown function (DUF5985)
MAVVVYVLSALTSLACGLLLLRGYARGKKQLLLWSGLCFLLLAVSNTILFVDLAVVQTVDLYIWRLSTAALAMVLLLYGLIWETK